MAKKEAAAEQPHDSGRCPSCGACKECGAKPQVIPYPYPVYPWGGQPYRPAPYPWGVQPYRPAPYTQPLSPWWQQVTSSGSLPRTTGGTYTQTWNYQGGIS